ncbi:MAG: hypothetical protein AB1330_01490 [Bacillota bacterium]
MKLTCWSCGEQQEVKVEFKFPEFGVVDHRCSCGARIRTSVLKKQSGVKYAAVYPHRLLPLDKLRGAVAKTGADVLLMPAERAFLWPGKRVIAFAVDGRATLPETVVHPEWENSRHPVYFSFGNYNRYSSYRARVGEMMCLADVVIVPITYVGGMRFYDTPLVMQEAQNRKKEVIVLEVNLEKVSVPGYLREEDMLRVV